jgi:hypothetical protein
MACIGSVYIGKIYGQFADVWLGSIMATMGGVYIGSIMARLEGVYRYYYSQCGRRL